MSWPKRIGSVFALLAYSVLAGAAEVKTHPYALQLGASKASFAIPQHDLVTVTAKESFVFYSIRAGYEQPDDGPYTNIPGEMSVRLVEGPLENAMAAQKKILINETRKIAKELKKDGGVIWLLEHPGEVRDMQTRRAVQFLPTDGGKVLMIDASSTRVKGMPPRNRQTIDELLLAGLKGIKLADKAVPTADVQKYVAPR